MNPNNLDNDVCDKLVHTKGNYFLDFDLYKNRAYIVT